MLQLLSVLMVALFFAANTALNVGLWIAAAVILVLLIMRRKTRKAKEVRGR
jgi:multisubunit Na+/H+ antiporter MnhB subunit